MGQKTWPPVLGGLAGLLNLPSMREPVCSAAPTLRPGGKKAFKLSSNSWVRAACGVLEDPVRELLPQGSTWPGYRDPCGSNSLASRSWGQLVAWLDALPPPPPPPPTSLSSEGREPVCPAASNLPASQSLQAGGLEGTPCAAIGKGTTWPGSRYLCVGEKPRLPGLGSLEDLLNRPSTRRASGLSF